MRDRTTSFAVALGVALAGVACSGGAERNVVSQYFTALRANDTNTLTSFAMVEFNQPVEDYKIVSVGQETRMPAQLPDLVKKQKEVEAELAKNTREARAWGNDLTIYAKLDQVRDLEAKGKRVPPELVPIQEKWDTLQAADRDLKKAVALARKAVDDEKHNVALSVGQIEDVESLAGEVVSKDIELELTIGGEKKPYLMTLRKYELAAEAKSRVIARWVIQSLEPKQ